MGEYITLYSDMDLSSEIAEIQLADAVITDQLGEGQPIQVFGRNTGGTVLREVAVDIGGDGARFVQLAAPNVNGDKPGVWADRGQGIILNAGKTLFPQQIFSFWARGLFGLTDREGVFPFQFVTRARSLGRQAT